MKITTTGPAIEGCEDPWEELALVLCRGIRNEATDLARYLELRVELDQTEAALTEARAALVQAKSALTAADAVYQEAVPFRYSDPFFAVAIALAVLGLVIPPAIVPLVAPGKLGSIYPSILGVMLLLGLCCAAVSAHLQHQRRSEALAARQECEATVGARDTSIRAIEDHLARIKAERASIQPRKSVRAVGRVYLPATVVKLGGRSVALDRSASIPPTRFRLADFEFDAHELKGIVGRIDALRQPPVLLTPDESAGHQPASADALHGEERALRETVEDFSGFIGRIPTFETSLPVVRSRTAVGIELSQSPELKEYFPGAVLRGTSTADHMRSVARLNATLGQSTARGSAPRLELLQAYRNIAALLEQYRSLRTTSINRIQAEFMDAMSRSNWCNIRFYCPKSTRNPAWILRRLGIDFTTAHQQDQTEIMRRLNADEEIRNRMNGDEKLKEELDKAWRHYSSVTAEIERCRIAARAGAAGIGAAQTLGGPPIGASVSHLESQQSTYIEQYRAALNRILFGQRRPLVEFSSAPRLTYDPDTGAWANETAGTEYHDLDEIACSRVLRIHEELLHPMWRHLWTEKADFRRSELFRTNEQMLDFSQRETAQLTDIATQFQNGMLSTRELLKEIAGDVDGKIEQIRGTRSTMSDLGLLDPEQAKRMSDGELQKLQATTNSALIKADQKEELLRYEPQAQLERRDLAADPIEVISNPVHLFTEMPAELYRRRIARDGDGGSPDAAGAASPAQGRGGGLP